MKLLQAYKFHLIGLVVGAVLGYLYYSQIGCITGTCAITSQPINSTLYGSVMGVLITDFFKKEK
ncbi:MULTISPECIES: DUF6132 family protein [unclassified Flammeovirga]|uniref:DUF6132 family protein n=1 Tax=unclassified Flammeovirga TaxID=2637820 RepID=UPI0005C4E54A|nr:MULTISPECIES: DUF6132 family protein [unclassified Flammeovirga]MBD0400312.1 hypothetical protein [Flammeovirga sp. EKP202]